MHVIRMIRLIALTVVFLALVLFIHNHRGDMIVELLALIGAFGVCCSGQVVRDVQRQVFHDLHRWMAATLDGRVAAIGAVFEAKFMLPGISRKKVLRKSIWPSCSTTCG